MTSVAGWSTFLLCDMCMLSISVQHSSHRPLTGSRHLCNLSNLIYPTRFTHNQHLNSGPCGTARQRPAKLSSSLDMPPCDLWTLLLSLSHRSHMKRLPPMQPSPHPTPSPSHSDLLAEGFGTGLLISKYRFSLYLLPNVTPFKFHAVSYPLKLNTVVLYRPPGPLREFLEELDVFLSNIPEDACLKTKSWFCYSLTWLFLPKLCT